MLNLPLSLWFALGFFAAACGALGGYGGRAIQLRMAFTEVWEAIDLLSRRISKREGQAGREKAIDNAKNGMFQQWAQRMRAGPTVAPGAQPEDEGARVANARQVFGRVDKAGGPKDSA